MNPEGEGFSLELPGAGELADAGVGALGIDPPDIWDWFWGLVEPSLKPVIDALKWVYDQLKPAIDRVWDWIWGAINWLWGLVQPIFAHIWNTVSTWVSWLWAVVEPIFDSIWNTVSTWVGWLWDSVSGAISNVWEQITSGLSWLWEAVSGAIGNVWGWISDWVGWLWDSISGWLSWLWDSISSFFGWLWDAITGSFSWLWDAITSSLSWLWDSISSYLSRLWDEITEDFSWMGDRLKELPKLLWDEIIDPFWDFIVHSWKSFSTFITEDLIGSIARGFAWFYNWIKDTIGSFWDLLEGFWGSHSPISPHDAPSVARNLLILAAVGVGGLAAMTVAGELLHPLKEIGLGHVAAMIGDLTNYRMISGVFMGAFLGSMLKTPLNYYFNALFRPWVLAIRDFMMLLSRDAFEHPETLRTPELISSVDQLSDGNRMGLINNFIGWYGYPGPYYGLFKELSYTRLGYFALAGIARSGFFDEEWFKEALARTGYSITAREALLDMYREQVRATRQRPAAYQIKRLYRDGFVTIEKSQELLAWAELLPSLVDIERYAMELERDYDMRDLARDIILRAYSRGVITEKAAGDSLLRLGMQLDIAMMEILRERLGLLKKVRLEAVPTYAITEFIEEE